MGEEDFGKRQITISENNPKRKWKEQKLYYFSLFGYKDKVERKWRKEKSIFIILYFFLSKFTFFDRKIAGLWIPLVLNIKARSDLAKNC